MCVGVVTDNVIVGVEGCVPPHTPTHRISNTFIIYVIVITIDINKIFIHSLVETDVPSELDFPKARGWGQKGVLRSVGVGGDTYGPSYLGSGPMGTVTRGNPLRGIDSRVASSILDGWPTPSSNSGSVESATVATGPITPMLPSSSDCTATAFG